MNGKKQLRTLILLALLSALAVTVAYQFVPAYRVKLGANDDAYARGFWPAQTDTTGNTYRWTKDKSQLVFHNAGQVLPSDRPATLELRAQAVRPPELADPEVKLFLEGNPRHELGTFELPNDLTTWTLTIDPRVAGPGDWIVDIESETFNAPGDGRDLGILLRRATLQTSSALPVWPGLPSGLLAALYPLVLFAFLRQFLIRSRGEKRAELVALGAALLAIVLLALSLAFAREQSLSYFPALTFLAGLILLALFGQYMARREWRGWLTRDEGYRALWMSGAALLVVSAALIWLTDGTAAGAALLVAGMALFWLAMRVCTPVTERPAFKPPSRREYFAIGLITLLALALRVYQLDQMLYGLFRDETRMGLLALRTLDVPSYRPIYEGPPISQSGLLIYLLALSFKVSGPGVVSLRLVGAIAGALTVPLLWRLARDWFGDARIALIAAFGLAVGTLHVYYSRFTLPYVESPLLSIPAYLFLARGLKDGRLRNYLLAGLFLGATQYASQVSRIALAVCAFLIFDEIVVRRGLPRNFVRGAAVSAATALIVLAPLIGFIIQQPGEFFARTEEVSLFGSNSSGEAPITLLQNNVLDYAGMFNVVGDSHGGRVVPTRPEFDPISGGLFVIGLLVALVQWREARNRRVLFWLIAALVPGLLSIEAPAPLRVLEVPAPTFILSGIGAVWLWGNLRDLARQVIKRRYVNSWATPLALAAVIAVLTLWINAHVLFSELGPDPRLWSKNQAMSTSLGATMAGWAAAGQIPASGPVYGPDWFIGQKDDRDVLNLTTDGYAYKFVSLAKAPVSLDGPALIARPNLAGYWRTILAWNYGGPAVLQRSIDTDKQAEEQIRALTAGHDVQELPGPKFPSSVEPAFWLYVVK